MVMPVIFSCALVRNASMFDISLWTPGEKFASRQIGILFEASEISAKWLELRPVVPITKPILFSAGSLKKDRENEF